MARKTARPELPTAFQSAIESILSADDNRDRQLRAFEADADRRPRVDHAAGRAEIAAAAQRTIDAAATMVDAEVGRIGREFSKHRRTSYDPAEIESGWRRVREQLDAGLGIADVVDSPGFDRPSAEAIRRNFQSWLTATTKGSNRDATRRQADEVIERVLKAELPLLDPVERHATEQEIGARAGRIAVEGLSRFMASPRDARARIRLGLDLEGAGYVSPPPAERPLAEAERERNSLSPELRAGLDGNLRDRPLAEPALAVRSR